MKTRPADPRARGAAPAGGPPGGDAHDRQRQRAEHRLQRPDSGDAGRRQHGHDRRRAAPDRLPARRGPLGRPPRERRRDPRPGELRRARLHRGLRHARIDVVDSARRRLPERPVPLDVVSDGAREPARRARPLPGKPQHEQRRHPVEVQLAARNDRLPDGHQLVLRARQQSRRQRRPRHRRAPRARARPRLRDVRRPIRRRVHERSRHLRALDPRHGDGPALERHDADRARGVLHQCPARVLGGHAHAGRRAGDSRSGNAAAARRIPRGGRGVVPGRHRGIRAAAERGRRLGNARSSAGRRRHRGAIDDRRVLAAVERRRDRGQSRLRGPGNLLLHGQGEERPERRRDRGRGRGQSGGLAARGHGRHGRRDHHPRRPHHARRRQRAARAARLRRRGHADDRPFDPERRRSARARAPLRHRSRPARIVHLTLRHQRPAEPAHGAEHLPAICRTAST